MAKKKKNNIRTPRLRIDINVYFHGKQERKYKKVTINRAKNILKDTNKKYN